MKKIAAAISIAAIVILAGFAFWHNASSPIAYSGKFDSIIIGGQPVEALTLIYVAKEKGFFRDNGINVTMKDYETGAAAFIGLEKNETDISVSSEYPVVMAAFKRENISIIGIIDKFQAQYIIARRDHGIKDVADLNGKKIGVDLGTIREFYLGRFLNLNDIDLQNVSLVDLRTSQSPDAIINGTVDAIIFYQPYVNAIKDQLGDNSIAWPAQSSQLTYDVISTKNDWAASHPEQINRLLKSLVQAEEYTINHPAEARAIVQKKLQFDDAYMAIVWPEHQFSLSLDQALVLTMEDQGRWMINNNLTQEKTVPHFLNYIYTKGLIDVKPEAVNIIQ